MCQLHFIKNPTGPITASDVALLKSKLKKGASYNPHGWGVFGVQRAEGGVLILKKPEAFTDADLTAFVGCDFVVGHNRMSTSGANDDHNTHPIELDHIVIAHNGVIAGRGNAQKSDTYKVALSLNTGCNEGITAKEEVALIARVFAKEQGTYSIFIYFKGTGNLYYFKNEMTEFTFKLLQKSNGKYSIVGATKAGNYEQIYDKSLYGFTLRKATAKVLSKLIPEDNVIYQITDGVHRVGEIKPKLAKAAAFASDYSKYWNSYEDKRYLTKWQGGY